MSLAHLAMRELFAYELPPELGCAELYLDRKHFSRVGNLADMQAGDLVWFGVQNPPKPPEEVRLEYDSNGRLMNWQEFPVKHVAIYTGLQDCRLPLLLHATLIEGGTIPYGRYQSSGDTKDTGNCTPLRAWRWPAKPFRTGWRRHDNPGSFYDQHLL